MTPFHERVYEEPVIVLRSQTTDGSGSEEKTIPFTVIPQVMLKQDGISTLELKRTLVRFSITDLSPGIWSLSAAGTVGYGDEKATWVAEPISFEVFDKSTLPYIFREYLNIWILCGLLAASTVVVLMWLRLRRRG